eukprot:TRINITY_DN37775_c0_g1_i1.p1 TRINITY_DN37775_c0_g1~~TRINITY_DN37775_c0_g1_i1.p1  ORF type:complete len:103 (+),score=0.44 TRINITY_DN37775_c0_g1_i1:113-421(+)
MWQFQAWLLLRVVVVSVGNVPIAHHNIKSDLPCMVNLPQAKYMPCNTKNKGQSNLRQRTPPCCGVPTAEVKSCIALEPCPSLFNKACIRIGEGGGTLFIACI